MNDLDFGTRNKRGDFRPKEAIGLPPFVNSPHTTSTLGWLKGLVWPWNALIIGISVFWWFVVVPDFETMKTFAFGWIAQLFLAKWVALFLWTGVFEWRLFTQRKQSTRFKYNGKFPADQPSDYFWFKSQNLDNFLRSMFVSVPICVAFEVVIFWAFANGHAHWIDAAAHPVYLGAIVVLTAVFHEAYFFFAHRAMHWKPWYDWCHKIHHNSVNVSPWTAMSNHPLESALQFAPAFLYLLVPATPFLAMHHLNFVAFSALVGHIGFDKIELGELGEHAAVDSACYSHYLHHKHFEVNYCDNGSLPWDHWFGSFHDGTAEGDRLMAERYQQKLAKLNGATGDGNHKD
jgi:sterol desaturase/sphingolipid hydroxylase (fatty acid hydroxylase superfamily)